MEFNSQFWNDLYEKKDTGWDIGYASPALMHYIEKITDKTVSILIPGAGNSHEGEYLFSKGYKNITLLDCSPIAKENFLKRIPSFPEDQFIVGDFFEHKQQYEVVMEQTFFCALHPSLRKQYAQKMDELITDEGILVGLLFDDRLNEEHPPFGGTKEEYEDYFAPYFSDISISKCYNSIPQRDGRELFILLNK